MRRQTRCVGHEVGFGNDPSELQAKSTSIRERSSSLGQTIHRPRRDDCRSSPYQAQCSGTFVDDASAIGFWERLGQVNRLAIQANSFTEMECVFVCSGRIVANNWPISLRCFWTAASESRARVRAALLFSAGFLNLLDSAEFEVFITQRSPLNPNEYRSACIGRGFSSVWGPTWKTRKILEWPHGGRLRQPVLMAGELDSWSGASF